MAIPKTEFIWHNGKTIPWDSATLHVLSHVVNYGSSLFEGRALLPDPLGAGDLPTARAHAAPAEFLQDLSH